MKLEEEVVRRQRERARILAWLLGAFVVLLFFITIAKTGINWCARRPLRTTTARRSSFCLRSSPRW
jgi:hypothetical protein